jgi:hypothetical protein
VLAQVGGIFASRNQNDTDMNTDNTLSFISSMISSETSYRTLVEMIDEMGLELMDVCMD